MASGVSLSFVSVRSLAASSLRGSAEDVLGPTSTPKEHAVLIAGPDHQPSSLPPFGVHQPLQGSQGSAGQSQQQQQRKSTINPHSRTNALNIVNDLLKRVGVSLLLSIMAEYNSNNNNKGEEED